MICQPGPGASLVAAADRFGAKRNQTMPFPGRSLRKNRPRSSTLDGHVLRKIALVGSFLQAELPFSRAFLYFVAFFAVAFAIALAAGRTYLSTNLLDYLFMVEQGWRLAQGQLPYRDFISPIGPVYYLLVGIVQHLAAGDAGAYRLTGFLAMLIFGPGLIWIAWRRLPGKLAVFVAAAFAMIPLTPRELDGWFFDFAFLALYNSLCWPLMATVILGSLFEARKGNGLARLFDGLAIGLAVFALLMLKLPHGVVAVGTVVIGYVLRPRNRLALAAAILFAGLLAGGSYLLAADLLTLYLRDFVNIGRANDLLYRLHGKLQIYLYHGTITLLLSVFAIWLLEKYRQYHPRKIGYGDIAGAATILLVSYGNAINDHENTPATLPLLFVLTWLCALRANLPVAGKAGRNYHQAKASLIALPFLLWLGFSLTNDGLALLFNSGSAWLRPAAPWLAAFPEQARLTHGLKLPAGLMTDVGGATSDDPSQQWAPYLLAVQDGIADLKALGLDHARIYEVRFNSILPWLLQAPPPRGVLAWLDIKRTFSLTAHPPAESYLDDIEVLMVSKLAYDAPWSSYFRAIYGQVMDRDFEPVHETTYWQIYKRRHTS